MLINVQQVSHLDGVLDFINQGSKMEHITYALKFDILFYLHLKHRYVFQRGN